MRPLRVKGKQRIRQCRASFENFGSFELLQFDLCRIKRHNVKRNAGAEYLLRGLDVANDIPLGIGSVGLSVVELTIPAINRSSHENDSFQLPECRRVAVNRRSQVRFRANGDKRDLTWM